MDTRPHNAATRTAACLDRVVASAARLTRARPAPSALDVWAEAFGVPPNVPAAARCREVARNLLLVAGEVDAVENFLASRTHIPAAVYEPKLRRVRSAIDLAQLTKPWAEAAPLLAAGDVAEYLRDTVAFLIGAQDAAPPSEALDRLRAQLADVVLESRAALGLPPPLRTFVAEVAESLTRAVRDYDIVGEAAIRREVERLLWEWAHVQPHVRRRTRPAKAWPALAKAGVALATAAGLVSNVDRLLESGLKFPRLVREFRANVRDVTALVGNPAADPPPSEPPLPPPALAGFTQHPSDADGPAGRPES